jgi:hypothetical protein
MGFDPDYTYDGKTEKDIRREAFTKIMDGVNMPQTGRTELLNVCLADHDRRELEKAFFEILSGVAWTWHDLNKWLAVFKERKKYPGSWEECLYQEPVPMPTTVNRALTIFSFKQQRALLKELGIILKPAPRTWIEVAAAFTKYIKIEAVLPHIENRYPEYVDEYLAHAQQAKACILANDITHLFLNLRRYYQSLDYIKENVLKKRYKYSVEVSSPFSSSVDKEYARTHNKKYNKGEITEIPPFYPGCPGMLRFDVI